MYIFQGLLRMSLLPRLRYILEIWRPSATVVLHILEILIRVCRHSSQAAYQVGSTPGNGATIVQHPLQANCSRVDYMLNSHAIITLKKMYMVLIFSFADQRSQRCSYMLWSGVRPSVHPSTMVARFYIGIPRNF